MKNILLFLSLFLISLLGVKNINETLSETEGVGVENVLQVNTMTGDILPVSHEYPSDCQACLDAESLVHQFRTCGRNQRTCSVLHVFKAKSSAYRIAQKYIEELFHSVTSIHSTLPFQSWAVASDHYIFGMRRILI